MQDSKSVPALVEAMSEEESLRVRNRIAQGIAEAGWGVPAKLHVTLADHLPPDFQLDSGKIVRVA